MILRHRRWIVSFLLVTVLGSPAYFSKVASPDVWKNLVSGRYLNWFHQFPHASVFATAPVKDFVPGDRYDWLGSVLLHLLHDNGGWILLAGLKVLPVLVLTLCLYQILTDESGLWTGTVCTVLVYGMAFRIIPRTSIFGLVFFPILLWIWYKFYFEGQRINLWIFPPLIVLWSNLHGSYLVGIFLLIGLGIGYGAYCLISNQARYQDLLILIVVGLITLLGLIFVGPYPDLSFYTAGLNNPSNPVLVGSFEWEFPSLKNLTQDLLFSDKIYVSPEHSYSLDRIYTSADYVIYLLVVPFVVVYLIFGWRSRLLPTLVGVLFMAWIGLAMQRALIYFGITAVFLLAADFCRRIDVTLGEKIWGSLSWDNTTIMVGILILVYVFTFPAVTCGYENLQPPMLQMYWEFGWGRHTAWKTEVPAILLEEYPDDKVFNHMALGSVLLYDWWPHKKVFWRVKTSDLTENILRKHRQGRIDLGYFREHGITLSVMPTKYANQPGNPYERLPRWCEVIRDEFMIAYRKCGM